MDTYTLHQGTAPLFISLPHNGTRVPDDIAARLTPEARRVPDTDWHVAELYGFARALGASIIVPVYSRYVVDLNRPEDDVSLYPGQNTTGLCPIVQFSSDPVYLPDQAPTPDDIAARVREITGGRGVQAVFDGVGAAPGDFYPELLRAEIDQVNRRVNDDVVPGVGFVDVIGAGREEE